MTLVVLTCAGMGFGIHHKFLHADIYTANINFIRHEQAGKAFKKYEG